VSIASRLTQSLLKFIQVKRRVEQLFKNPPRNTGTMNSHHFKDDLALKSWHVDGFKILSIQQSNSNSKHIIFLPGGAYNVEATPFHRKFMETLAIDHGLAITYIDYPKSPEYTYQTTLDVVVKAYLEVVQRNPGCDFYIVGDSAGGGLALALLQILRDRQTIPFPKKSVLISPWLDLTMSNEKIQEYESRDCLLPVEGLINAGKLYSGGEDLRNPLLSPIFGDLSNLGEILLIFGTNEVFYPDCVDLADKLSRASGSSVDFIIGQNLMHDWVIFPFKESKSGVRQIAQFLIAD
jgi:monoterpene epsilon-lactone hydrolase